MLKKVSLVDEKHGSSNRTRGLPIRLILMLLVFLVACLVFAFTHVNTVGRFGFDAVDRVNFDPCIGESKSLDKWVITPSNLMHNMSDEELFWRATFVPKIEKYPFRRNPKIAFMFLVKGPLPLAPLWERFFKGHEGHYSIYIHSQPSYSEEFSPGSVFYNRQIPSQVVEWGEMSMCDAEKRLLANALLDISNEWFILLSESCIPLYNFTFVFKYITRSKYNFISVFDDPGKDGRGRYNESMAPEVNITEWRKGWQWFEVNRKLAIKMVQDTIYHPKFKAFCKIPCYPDEHYFQTLLSIQAPRLLANRSLTWVDWSELWAAHPATYGRADITMELFKKIMELEKCDYNGRNSSVCYVFARKFVPDTLEPLLKIAKETFGY